LSKVFLGGTWNGSSWRNTIIPMLTIDYFNPVVENWTEECMAEEIKQREECDYGLYVITPKMTGVFSIAEVTADACRKPGKTILVVLHGDGRSQFSTHQLRSLESVQKLVSSMGATVLPTLEAAAEWMNRGSKTLVIDLDKESIKSIKESIDKSPWIPKEYFMNDVVADIKCFLEGINPYPTEAEMLEAETSKWMDDAHDYVPDSVVKRGVIYIAGPMRGYKNLNLKAFFDAEKKLKKDGWVVINPAKNPPGMSLDRKSVV